VSSDGIEDVQHESGYGGVNGGTESQIETETETITQGTAEVNEEDRARPQQRRASSQLVDDDIHGDIVAVRVTRSGHLFATLTRTTLTVWQTKACLFLYMVGIC
jgi:hypothetical protein